MKLSVITPTHNVQWLADTWRSLQLQTHTDFEWVVVVNNKDGRQADCAALAVQAKIIVGDDPRVRIMIDSRPHKGVGFRKRYAFMQGEGEALVELDHDDLLTPDALAEIAAAFNTNVGFVYSDFADFDDGVQSGQGKPDTYCHPDQRPKWDAVGFKFYFKPLDGVRPGVYECVSAFPPNAHTNALIFHAPNHVRAWRRSLYHKLGGHNEDLPLADDHDLVVRTYLTAAMYHIPKPLYLYRRSATNTFSSADNTATIERLSYETCARYSEALALHDARRAGLPAFDLGGGFNTPDGWLSVDIDASAVRTINGARVSAPVSVQADLRGRWPWPDNSVGAFRAMDFLEHLPDKMHTMSELYRCLRPGGWLVSSTPSTDGRGAWQDPTHVSFWNQNSFWYWIMREHAQFIRNTDVRFHGLLLYTNEPSDWHKLHKISYVHATLIALKPGYEGPGEKLI